MKNNFFRRIGSYLFILFFPMVVILSISVSKAMGTVYDDFNGSEVDLTLWNISEGGDDVFTQSGGLLHANVPPEVRAATLTSRNRFRGDVEFVLDFRDFQTAATISTMGPPSVALLIYNDNWDYNCILISLYHEVDGNYIGSALCGVPDNYDSIPTSATSGLFKISKIGSTVTTSYNVGGGWVDFRTFTGLVEGDVKVSIEVQTGDNGSMQVSSDWITYEGQMLPPFIPDVKANGSDGPITITTNDTLSVTVELDAEEDADADWWVVADTPFGWYYYNLLSGWLPGLVVTYQGPLFVLSPYEVLNTSILPIGTYTFYFGVDMLMNGIIDMSQMYYDSVEVTITP